MELNYTPPELNYTIREWVEIFPTLRSEIAPAKLKELRVELRRVRALRERKHAIIEESGKTATGKWVGYEWVKINEGQRIKELLHHIDYFKRILTPPDPNDPFPQMVEDARRVSLITLAGRRIPTLKKAGKEWMGLCPFHEEKTPSFSINPQKNLFYCHGCQAGGGVIDFIMLIDNLTFPEAVRRIVQL